LAVLNSKSLHYREAFMNGAESLLRTLCDNGVRECFANPGTSEMHLVAALDRDPRMRCVLGLFEGVVTGAADGYGRMLDRPAATLLHLGPGLANGLSNLHNALRAQSPIVNIVGDHAVSHRALDAPLTSDVEGTARPFSHWVRTSQSAATVTADTLAAIAAAKSTPGRVATLIVPADATWNPVPTQALAAESVEELVVAPARPTDESIDAAARALAGDGPAALVLGGRALREDALVFAGRIAAATGARLLHPTHTARVMRGAGRVGVERIPYPVDQAQSSLADLRTMILVGATAPVAFFAYPGRPGRLYSPHTRVVEMARPSDDLRYALEALADRVAIRGRDATNISLALPARPTGEITRDKLGALLAATLPENAIVIDESITTGRGFLAATRSARPHDWLFGTGGSIGYGLAAAVGAAVACPDRPVIVLESDGSGMYMPQAFWTMARESLNVVTLVFANRKYQILKTEMANIGVGTVGPRAARLLDIGQPDLDWVGLARSQGVPGRRATSMGELSSAMDAALTAGGPQLIEVVL
jgi:acetolactate synthase-1/2/3 large subunit